MDIRPALSFSNRLSLREFEAEMWKLYFGFTKGLLMAIASVIYLFVLTAFFIAQHAVLIASKVTGSVIDWSPEKPRVFGRDQRMGSSPLALRLCVARVPAAYLTSAFVPFS